MADHNATVAQTFPAITQSATGDTDFFSVLGQATITESVVGSFSQSSADTLECLEFVTYSFDDSITQVLNLSDAVEYYSSIDVTGSLTGDDVVVSAEWTTSITPTGGNLYSSVEHFVTLPIDEVLTATESVELSVTLEYTDTLTTSNVVEPSGQNNVEVTDVLRVSNQYLTGLGELVSDTLVATNTVASTAERFGETEHTLTAREEVTGTYETFEELTDEIRISEVVSYEGSVGNDTVHDTVIVKDSVWANDFGAVAWVLNTETGGAYSYDNFGYDSLTVHNGVMYATSPEGVFALTHTHDQERDIDALLKTGFLDMGAQQTKRISDVYVGYTGGQLQLDVETYDGPQEVYTYDMEERDADAPRNNRIKVGKGLSSRYWRFSVRNVDGADFQVYDMSAIVGVSKRRL